MNRSIIGLALLVTFPLLAHGQSATPEFGLVLHYSEASSYTRTLSFGYDPRATAGKDTAFGEEDFPNFGAPSGDPDLNFTYDDTVIAEQDAATYIDILHKPQQGSFALQYLFHLSAGTYPGHLAWDLSKIPPEVTGIVVTPLSATNFLLVDMKQQPSYDIEIVNNTMDPHDYSNWKNTVITIYYNMPTPFQSAVAGTAAVGGLLQAVNVYPNPLSPRSTMQIVAGEPSSVTITGYDAAGRECLRESKEVSTGVNAIDLQNLKPACGAIMLHIEATNGTLHETRNVMVVKD